MLKVIDNEKLQGSIIHSRVKWVEEGERSSKSFFDLEKQSYLRKFIQKLKTNSGEIITDPEEIALYQRQFYEKLLTSQRCNKSNYCSFINDICAFLNYQKLKNYNVKVKYHLKNVQIL